MNVNRSSNTSFFFSTFFFLPLGQWHLSSRVPTHSFLNHYTFLHSELSPESRGWHFFVLYLQATGCNHPICLECNFGLKEPELMEEQKQLNPNCSSFHCPKEKRVNEGGEVLWILCPCPSLRVEPWTILIVPIKWHLGASRLSACLDLGEHQDFCFIKWK